MRTIIDLTKEQVEALKEIATLEKVSRAELIRRAVSEYIKKQKPSDLNSAFGLWSNRKIDSIDYVKKIRKEWNR